MSQHVRPRPVVIPEQPAILVVGDRRIQVDNRALNNCPREHRDVELVRSSDSLVIEPQRRAWVRSLVFTLVIAVPSLVCTFLWEIPWWLAAIILFVVFLALLRFSLSRLEWITFDRRAKQLQFDRRVGFRKVRCLERTYPLESILAVQLLYNGRHTVEEWHHGGAPGGGDSYFHRSFHAYELNLVLDNPSKRRLNLLCIDDYEWIRETGRHIGEFLGLPVIDKLHHGGVADVSVAAEN